jgi:hypothetical protein
MQTRLPRADLGLEQTHHRLGGRRLAIVVGLGLLLCALLPIVPILLGVFLLGAVAVHAWAPELRPYVEPFVRVPIDRPGKRATHLLLVAGAGVLLVMLGSVSASIRGSWSAKWEVHQELRATTDDSVTRLLDRAEALLAASNVAGAELALVDARSMASLDPRQKGRIDDLLGRIRRSGDSEVIGKIVAGLTRTELAALQSGTAVPEALEFGERALTYRAVELALALLEAERTRSGGR